MRFKINLEQTKTGQLIPLSYQYEMSSWIYKLIASVNAEFSEFLHHKGFGHQQKTFKFFCFSQLLPGDGGYKILGDRMQVNAKEISFECGFLAGDAAQYLITGLFENQQMSLGDRQSKAFFNVKSVELLNLPDFSSGTINFRTASPLLLSMPVELKGKLGQRYLSPKDDEFTDYLSQNLIHKYIIALEHKLANPIASIENSSTSFKLLSKTENIKSRLISIKSGTAAETKLKGFMFDFSLNAAPELLKIAYLSGFGIENAMGFGTLQSLK